MDESVTLNRPRVAWHKSALPPRVKEMSRRAKIIHFGALTEGAANPWTGIAGMFQAGRRMTVEELLESRGFDESGQDI